MYKLNSSENGYKVFFFFFLLLLSSHVLHEGCSPSERASLLLFRSNLTFSSENRNLGSWVSMEDCCNWEGVSCDVNGLITAIHLPSKGLEGPLSSSLAGLPYLTELNLSYNKLTGNLPTKLLSSATLLVLDVSFNRLSGNLPMPPAGNFSLQVLSLSSNSFTGPFPDLGSLARFLTVVNVSNNGFFGRLPSSICSLSPMLKGMDFSHNQFSHGIPPGLGSCALLTEFQAGNNYLSGPIPPDLFNMASLHLLSLPFNKISGSINGNLIIKLQKLTFLDLSNNQLSGQLPASISQLQFLEQLDLYGNQLSGTLPPGLSNCTRLKILNLRFNNLSGKLSAINFSTLTDLSMLDLGNNMFTGGIPATLYSLQFMKALRLAKNSLEGEIAQEMAEMRSLSYLSLSSNRLTNIEMALQILKDCKNLTSIVLSKNFIKEAMPMNGDWAAGAYFQNLQILSLGGCKLTGEVPFWLADLGNLLVLDLSENQLTGSVPPWLGSLPHLFYLDLSENLLSGLIPTQITELQALMNQSESKIIQGFLEFPVFIKPDNGSNLQYNQLTELPPAIYLQKNALHGRILPQIGQLKNLRALNLNHNNFSGGIPVKFCNLTNLEKLDLSSNHLSGRIPSMLNRLHFLASFNVSNNDLEGAIPLGSQFDLFPLSSYAGNPKLCGPFLMKHCLDDSGNEGLPPPASKHMNKKTLICIATAVCLGGSFFLIMSAFTILYIMKGQQRNYANNNKIKLISASLSSFKSLPAGNPNLVMVSNAGEPDGKSLTMSDILTATNNFDQENIIGSGGFGMVYKAALSNGTRLAIKRLSGEMCLVEREFRAEVEALSRAQHKNLVSLHGYCMHGSSWLLVYSYMENGSLDYWLHEKINGGVMLDWPTRLKIAQGTSQGLSYIHETCQPHIVHRDIKSSNILLDEHFEARVADFGLSRLILPYNTHVSTELVGTLGYIPPEYGQAWTATLRGDIYSFGVVLLELLSGRRPFELFRPKESAELVAWGKQMRFEGKEDEIFDELLKGKGYDEQMLNVLDIAFMCVNSSPLKRPIIREVVTRLGNIGVTLQTQ